MFQGYFKSVSRKLKKRLKEILRVFQGCFKEISGFSRKFKGYYKGVFRVFQGSFKDVSRKFKG